MQMRGVAISSKVNNGWKYYTHYDEIRLSRIVSIEFSIESYVETVN
jgi:hypothetical protein